MAADRTARAESPVIELLTQGVVCGLWRLSVHRVNRLANSGELKRYGRAGHQAYYALDNLVEVLGPPQIAWDDLNDYEREVLRKIVLLGGRLRFPFISGGEHREAA